MRKYKRWISSIGSLGPKEIQEGIEACGLKLVVGFKPNMHVYYEFGLEGTKHQIVQFDQSMREHGHEVRNRKPTAAFGFNWPESRN